MDPVAASENFLRQVGQNNVRTLFGGKETKEKKQEATREEGVPNLSPQGIDTTAEVSETPVDPPDDKAVFGQANHDDAPTSSPPGPDISETPHPGQTEYSILQERKTEISDSSQPTAADEEATERRHGRDDQSTQIAVVRAEPLESPDSRALLGDTCATQFDSVTQLNRSERSAEGLAPVIKSKALSCQDQVDWKENVQGVQLHSDSQGLQNIAEDTTVQDSAAPTRVKAKFMDKTEIQVPMQSEESLHGISVVETLSKDKTAHTSHQESEESVCTAQSPGADSSESYLAADAGTASIPLRTSCSEQIAEVKETLPILDNQEEQPLSNHTDDKKFVTQTGQLEENNSETVNLGDTDKTALESGASSVVKEITTSHDTMLEEVQPGPSLAANSDQPLHLDQERQQSPNPDSHISIPDVQGDVEDTEDLCKSVEKAVATETKATVIGIPEDTPGAKQDSDVGDFLEQSSCLLEGTQTTDTAAPVNKPKAVQETGVVEIHVTSPCFQAMTEAIDTAVPMDTHPVVQEAPRNEPQEKPPCFYAEMKDTPQADQDSVSGDLTEKPPHSQGRTEASLSGMTVDSPQVLEESTRDNIVDEPSGFQSGRKESDTDIPADTHQAEQESGTGDMRKESPRPQAGAEASEIVRTVAVPQAPPESGSGDIQERPPCFQAQLKETDTVLPADTLQPKPDICTGENQGDSTCPPAGTKATGAEIAVNTTRSNPESGSRDLRGKPSNIEVETKESNPVIAVDRAGANQESSTEEMRKKPSFCHAGTTETDTAMPADTHQAVQETDVRKIQKMSSHPQAAGLSNTSTLKVEATKSATLDAPRSVPKPGGRKIRKKLSCIQAGIQDTPMSADKPKKARDSGAGGVHEEFLFPQSRTDETDTPASVDISQADQEVNAGTNRQKSPHSHADAEASESTMPAIPSYTQTQTKKPDITMPVDTHEADKEKQETRETSFQPDDVCSKLTAEEINAKKMKSRLERSFEALPSLSQIHDILRQLYGKLIGNRVLVLLGEAGSGKTTAAIWLAHYAPVWCGASFDSYLYYGDNELLPESVTDFPSQSLIVIDNFLGRYDADGLSYWNTVVPLLESMKENEDKQILLLLTSRTTIFQNVLSSEETDVNYFLDENHVTTVTIDYRKMWKDICADVKLKAPDFENLPSIGFPFCCQLAPHLAPDRKTILFQQPRLALRRMVRTLMDSTGIARTALTLLAVTDGSLDIEIFTSLARLQESTCYEIMSFLPQTSYDKETSAQIIAFYKHSAFLFQVCDIAVSFRSEIIREAVLVILCDSHAELLAKYCSLELLSQIALATSDKGISGDAEKPALSDSAKSTFLRRLIKEINDVSNFDAMFSPLFQHHSILSMFTSTVKEESLLKQWTQKYSRSGLHFVFYAGAVPPVFRNALSELEKTNLWVVLQAVLACCYWGYDREIAALMKVWKNKTDLKKALKEATILDIVTGNLPGLSRREEPRWEMTPLFPEDTLLVLAARKGKDDVVKNLAFRDMNVNSQGMAGRTALMHYCARGRTDMVKFLLSRKAATKIRDKWGMTALMYALQQKQWDIPEDLMTTESCRAENTYLQSPLTFACTHEWSTQMIKTLMNKGADLLQRDKWSYTCLHYACLQGHTDIVEYLLKQKKVDVRGKTAFGHTPLALAVTGPGRSKLAKLLLNTEATKDVEDVEVINMVCLASESGVMKTLLSDCRQEKDVKNFSLHKASMYGNTEMVRYLLQSGVDAAATIPPNADTALHYACIGSSVDCCDILLKKIDPNVQSTDGSTPLMTALEGGALDCARLLFRQGAKMNLSSTLGSCLHHATVSNLCSVLDWCIKENKMDVNSRNNSDMTPLQVACEGGLYHSVKYLLDNGADILKVYVKGDTCLHHAAKSGHWDIVRLLEKVDPSLMNAPNAFGETSAQLLKTSAPTSQSASAECANRKLHKEQQKGQATQSPKR